MDEIWRPDLQTTAYSLFYDFARRTGTLMLPPVSCTDMTGAIALFTAIDPHVQRIETRAGSEVDTTYVHTTHGWEARLTLNGGRMPNEQLEPRRPV